MPRTAGTAAQRALKRRRAAAFFNSQEERRIPEGSIHKISSCSKGEVGQQPESFAGWRLDPLCTPQQPEVPAPKPLPRLHADGQSRTLYWPVPARLNLFEVAAPVLLANELGFRGARVPARHSFFDAQAVTQGGPKGRVSEDQDESYILSWYGSFQHAVWVPLSSLREGWRYLSFAGGGVPRCPEVVYAACLFSRALRSAITRRSCLLLSLTCSSRCTSVYLGNQQAPR